MPGPVPKRSDQRRRVNKPAGPELIKAPGAKRVARPRVDSNWHPIARDWFKSLGDSGQAQFYEPSDWQNARFVAELMSRALNQGQRISAQLVTAILSAQTDLLTTEGARRRARIELERGEAPPESPSIAIMDRYRAAAGSK